MEFRMVTHMQGSTVSNLKRYYNLKRRKSRPYINIVRQTKYAWFEASSMYLVGLAGCNLLWAAQNEWDYHEGSLSTSIDAIESIPKR